MYRPFCVCAIVAVANVATAAIVTKPFPYEHGDVNLAGYLCVPAGDAKLPAVIVIHEWWGLNEFARRQAERVAELGYVALAVDMYGDGKVTDKPEEAGKLAGAVRESEALWRGRAKAAFDALAAHPRVDASRIAAMGYCFGGATALQMAYAGIPIVGAISFHGSLPAPSAADLPNIRARLLVLHGAADPLVPAEQIAAFQKALRESKVDWQMVYYGGAVHSFTNPGAGRVGIAGVAYNEAADRRSWQDMKQFLEEVFAK
jgi:dienelactone hydrolase